MSPSLRPAAARREESDQTVVAKPSPRRRKEEEIDQTVVAKPRPAPAAEKPAPAARPMTPAGEWLKKASQDKITLNLSYRAMALGGLALVVVCCLGSAGRERVDVRPGGRGGPAGRGHADADRDRAADSAAPVSHAVADRYAHAGAVADRHTGAHPNTRAARAHRRADAHAGRHRRYRHAVADIAVRPATRAPAATRPAGANRRQPVAPTASFKYPAPVQTWPEDNGLIPTKIWLAKMGAGWPAGRR